jgi:hypothetical protein
VRAAYPVITGSSSTAGALASIGSTPSRGIHFDGVVFTVRGPQQSGD